MRTRMRTLLAAVAVIAAPSAAVATGPARTVISSSVPVVLTIDVRVPLTIDAAHLTVRSGSHAAVLYVHGLKAGLPSWGAVVLPEIGDTDVVALDQQSVRLPTGRYEFSLLS